MAPRLITPHPALSISEKRSGRARHRSDQATAAACRFGGLLSAGLIGRCKETSIRAFTQRDGMSDSPGIKHLMPTVLIIQGFRFFFFSNEGSEPPHIHVEKGDGYAKFWLNP